MIKNNYLKFYSTIFIFVFFFSKVNALSSIAEFSVKVKDKNPDKRYDAIQEFHPSINDSEMVIPILLRLMKEDPDGSVRESALKRLGDLKGSAIPIIPEILALRKKGMDVNDRPKVAYMVIYEVLKKVGPDCIPDILKVLRNEKCDEQDYFYLTGLLSSFGFKAHKAVPLLIKTVDFYPGSYDIVGRIISRISNHHTPYLLLILKDSGMSLTKREAAASALGYLREKDAISSLVEIINDKDCDETFRKIANGALRGIKGR